MMIVASVLSIAMLIGGGVLVEYNTVGGVSMIFTSPLPVLVYKFLCQNTELETPPKLEDPVAPTPDEPSAV